MGIVGKLFDWLSNYLKERRKRVFIGQSQSQFKTITSGVPQGSYLGPLLSITKLFTDDTSLATTTTNVEEMQGILNHKLSEMVKTIAGYI